MRIASHSRRVARAFGQALRAERARKGISQDRLGELCDLDRTYPSLLERGLRGPTVAMLLRLSGGLGVEPEQLLADMLARLRN
jgi:transcriptional regulator with XRE-family HTH domain